jgi:vacuolar-type H+-ATPase subunit F/Vma7
MTLSVQVLCRADAAGGFALSGLKVVEAATPSEAAERLAEMREGEGTGVVLMEDAFYDALPDDVKRELGRRPLPMIVPFPGPRWEARAEDAEAYIVELLRQVVGYRVRLK